jgi:hypothetical protein
LPYDETPKLSEEETVDARRCTALNLTSDEGQTARE